MATRGPLVSRSGTPRPAVLGAWGDAWARMDPAALAALFTEDGVYESGVLAWTFVGRAEIAEYVTTVRRSVPGVRFELGLCYQAGSLAGAQWTAHGTPVARMGDLGPGDPVVARGVSAMHLRDGRISRCLDYYAAVGDG